MQKSKIEPVKLDFDAKISKMGPDRVITIPRAFKRMVEGLTDEEHHIKIEIE